MRVIDCPECKVVMQPFFAEAGDGGLKVELDRCPKCTRLWFDVRELERAVGKAFLPRLRGSDASHECPVCKLLMGTSLISGDVAIEECAQCGGALLDANDFLMISGKSLKEAPLPKAPPPPAPPPPKKKEKEKPKDNRPLLVEFTCERCRQRTPYEQAGNVNGATVCRSCEMKPWPNQPTWYSNDTDGEALSDIFDAVINGLFRR